MRGGEFIDFMKKSPMLNIIGIQSFSGSISDNHKFGKPELVYLFWSGDRKLPMGFIKQLSTKSILVIVSNNPELSSFAWSMGAFDYILTPCNHDRFLSTLVRLNNISSILKPSEKKHIFIRLKKGVFERILLSEILWIEAAHNYSLIHLNNLERKKIVYASLTELEEKLKKNNFLRVHKSYIVNLSLIRKVEGNLIYIEGRKEPIPCGTGYKKMFLLFMDTTILNTE